jgi:hypothetical protein
MGPYGTGNQECICWRVPAAIYPSLLMVCIWILLMLDAFEI